MHRAPGGWAGRLNVAGWVAAAVILFAAAFFLAETFL
jgi:hypothetical protein